jgi:carboxyl-terminal processing protease
LKEVSNRKYKIAQPLLLSFMVALGMFVGFNINSDSNNSMLKIFPGETEINLGRVEEVIRLLDSKYLYEPDAPQLTDELIQQIFSKLDPYSMYIPAKDLGSVNDNMNGNYKGIGIETIFVDDTILVTGVLKNSPAELAGLKKLDRIIAVDSFNFAGSNLDFQKFKYQIQQSTSLEVILEVFRKRNNETLQITLIPEKVENPSIRHFIMLDDSTLYVKIDQFVSNTYREFMQVLESVQIDSKLPHLIIDVRNNPGGYLTEVTKILSQFFDESGKLLVKTVVRNGSQKEYKTTGRSFFEIGDITILINQNSASGSEVLSGALQDWDRARIIGKRSYGKGLVQEQYDLSQGGAARLTVANYYLPSGRSIQHNFDLDTSYFNQFGLAYKNDSTFQSLINNRPLYASNGINPDIEVEDSLYVNLIWPKYIRDSWLDAKLINYLDQHKELAELTERQLTELLFDEQELDTFKWWKSEGSMGKAMDDESLIILLRSKLAYFLFDEELALKTILMVDPYLKAAGK